MRSFFGLYPPFLEHPDLQVSSFLKHGHVCMHDFTEKFDRFLVTCVGTYFAMHCSLKITRRDAEFCYLLSLSLLISISLSLPPTLLILLSSSLSNVIIPHRNCHLPPSLPFLSPCFSHLSTLSLYCFSPRICRCSSVCYDADNDIRIFGRLIQKARLDVWRL